MKFVVFVVALISFVIADDCNPPYGQCGGNGWTGPICCTPGYTCTEFSQWYSNCRPNNSTLPPSSGPVTPTSVPTFAPSVVPTLAPTNAPTNAPTPAPTQACAAQWTQCGGQGWTGPTCCITGFHCVQSSIWYSSCQPN